MESFLCAAAASASASTSAHECSDVDRVRRRRPALSCLLSGLCCGRPVPPGRAFLAASVKWIPCRCREKEGRSKEREWVVEFSPPTQAN